MKIHVLLKKEDIDREKMGDNKIAVVFDVLLATSTITAALEFGAKEVIPVLDGAAARAEAEGREDGSYVLVGEYEGKTIDGFLSPNPLELKETIQGRTVILSTTNGTVALKNCEGARAVYAASLLNARAVAYDILNKHKGETIVVVCAGSSGQFNVEDFLGAGCFIDSLVGLDSGRAELTDSAFASLKFYQSHCKEGNQLLKASRVGKMLARYGFEKEIKFVAQENVLSVVPFLQKGRLIKGDGTMPLKPEVEALLKAFSQNGLPPLEEQPVEVGRKGFEMSATLMSKADRLAQTEDLKINGFKDEIAIRVYTPEGIEGPLPVIVYYHGGGWVIGNIATHDALCHMLAYDAAAKVVSVDYSLAPESKFPVAVEDCYLAAKWVYDNAERLNVDRAAIAVAGDSAGGNLAAVVSYLAVERKTPDISFQILLYPSTGFEPTESYEKFGEGYYLTKSTMAWFRDQYLNSGEDKLNPLAAPLLIPDEATAQLPPAYIMTAEFDPLCDGGEQYAAKLKAAGVETEYKCFPGMIHGFVGMTEYLPDGKAAIKEAAAAFKAHARTLTAERM